VGPKYGIGIYWHIWGIAQKMKRRGAFQRIGIGIGIIRIGIILALLAFGIHNKNYGVTFNAGFNGKEADWKVRD
jgi:hypothetical protein